MMHDLLQISAILEMESMRTGDDLLRAIYWHDTLLSNYHHRNHKVTKVEWREEPG